MDRGFEVTGVDMEPAAVAGAGFVRVPAATHPDFLEVLQAVSRAAQVDLIIPTVTEELIVLARHESLGQDIPVVVGPAQAVALANDKWLTCRRLLERGLSVPAFALPSEIHSEIELARRVGLPYLTKPRVSRGGRGVKVLEVFDDLLSECGDFAIVQEFIPGTEYAPNLYLMPDERDDVVVVLEKTALAHGLVGNALAVRRTVAADVATLARDAARGLGLMGPVDVDIRRRADGTPVVLEINARFGANSSHAPEVLDALLSEYVVRESVAA
jgi:carbamoylphosphate synthase large subunit